MCDTVLVTGQPTTVQFLYLETCGVRNEGKMKERGGTGYEASTCSIARDVSEKYQCQIHQLLQQ